MSAASGRQFTIIGETSVRSIFTRSVPRRAVLFATLVPVLLAFPRCARAHDVPEEMAEAAGRFLKSLGDDRRKEVTIALDDDKRAAWHYIPSSMMDAQGGRRGLPIKKMSPEQRALAHGLLNTALSHHGYFQAMTIMALESILRNLENGNPARDPEMYHVAVYGEPSSTATWGWSVEGHHLSVNITLVDGQRFSVTPSFFGSNPAIAPSGPQQGLETLAAEQQLARQFVHSLSADQRKLAVIAEKAPQEIITAAERRVGKDQFQPPQGIPFDQLNPQQRAALLELVRHFAWKYRHEIIDQIAARTPIIDGTGMVFAWAGGVEPGDGHYYRIQTPQFLFEYDNTQNNANHVHTVWRQFDGDFGEDLLRQHYETSPHHQHQ